MSTVASLLSIFLAWLCQIFQVTPESITQDRRGNMPPPSGGIGASRFNRHSGFSSR